MKSIYHQLLQEIGAALDKCDFPDQRVSIYVRPSTMDKIRREMQIDPNTDPRTPILSDSENHRVYFRVSE